MIRAYISRRQYICAVPLLVSAYVLIRAFALKREGKLMVDGKRQPLLVRFNQCRESPGREESSETMQPRAAIVQNRRMPGAL